MSTVKYILWVRSKVHSNIKKTPSLNPMTSFIVGSQRFTILEKCCIFSGDGNVTCTVRWQCNFWSESLSCSKYGRMQMGLYLTASTNVYGPWYCPNNKATGLTVHWGTMTTHAHSVICVTEVQVVEECQEGWWTPLGSIWSWEEVMMDPHHTWTYVMVTDAGEV